MHFKRFLKKDHWRVKKLFPFPAKCDLTLPKYMCSYIRLDVGDSDIAAEPADDVALNGLPRDSSKRDLRGCRDFAEARSIGKAAYVWGSLFPI